MVSSLSTFRGKQRIIVVGLLLMAGIFYFGRFDQLPQYQVGETEPVYQYSCHITRSLIGSPTDNETAPIRQHTYLNLNDLNSTRAGKQSQEHVLVLTTVGNDEAYLDNYFDLLDKSSYPNSLISIGLLVSDSTDDSLEKIYQHVNRLQTRWRNTFDTIDVYQKDFKVPSKTDDTSLDSKRATLARARNFLLSISLKEYHSWVVWVDIGLYSYPQTIFEDLMMADADVVVPNCLLKRDDDEFWGFDRNNWQESDASLKYQQELPLNQVLMEDYNEYSVGRNLLVDMPTNTGKDYKVPLDGVGTTFTMVKATVHREGAVFPPFVYQHELDTEGFAKIVKSMGFSVYGIPSYTIYHH
ncbi:Anp1-domain-containing protein [Mucor mucedo]|uniref:Uncharacterized protein n=1 Tax=Mucor saturninus TaxID=64648 RepID=A0A8H7R9K4_9FUNG|nr:Anp1-domain-containing protein [Mucor mucedo]KAG2206884.1 hypothetical protein INT47_007641 [Mucor saturninus]KAI7888010.1 Anp1-domain-containing protein [Mucor mucedo]